MTESAFREHFFTAQDGRSLYYREYGNQYASGPAIVCLSGLTRNSKDFHGLATRLAANHRVLCPDYRGRGRSDYDPDLANYQPSTYLSDVRHLLAVAHAEHVIVIGTSLGGLLAMAMGAAMPTCLAGVILNDIGPEVGGSGLDRILAYVGADRPHKDWDSAVDDLRKIFPNLSLNSDAEWLDAAQATWRKGADGMLHFDWDVNLVEALEKGPPVPDLWPLFLSLNRIPTLAIRGALSDVLTFETFEKMAFAHSGLDRVTVPNAGHVPTLSEPSVRDRIDAFVIAVSSS